MRRLLMVFAVVVGLAAAGAGAWWWVVERPAWRLGRSGQAQLEAGHLREAATTAALLQSERPEDPAGWVLGARVALAQADEPTALELMDRALYLAPRGFPLLAERTELRLHGPSDPKRGFDEVASLASHELLFPEDAPALFQARMYAVAWLLAQPALSGEQRETTQRLADTLLGEKVPEAPGTAWLHDRAQLLLAFGRREDALTAARAGFAANTDRWRAFLLKWSVASSFMHDQRDEQSYKLLSELHADLVTWPGTHFGMGQPMVDFIELTAAIRFGQDLRDPGRTERLARLEKEGVRVPQEVVDIRQLITELRGALDQKNTFGARERAEALLKRIQPGDGTPMENEFILPSIHAVVRVCLGDLLLVDRDFAAADRNYRLALVNWPDDLWIDSKITTAWTKAQGDSFDPSRPPADLNR